MSDPIHVSVGTVEFRDQGDNTFAVIVDGRTVLTTGRCAVVLGAESVRAAARIEQLECVCDELRRDVRVLRDRTASALELLENRGTKKQAIAALMGDDE